MAEVHPITHLFCEDVSRIDLPRDVMNIEHLILDPFTNGVFVKLDVPGSLQSHVVGPLHAGIVVVVENNWEINVRNNVTGLRITSRKIPEVNKFLGGCVCSSDLGFPGIQGGTFLAIVEPFDGAPVFEDDSIVHAAEFKKWEECTLGN
jgi:hypothetical protein